MTTATTPDFVLAIVQQLGGFNRLRAFVNAKNFLYTNNETEQSLQFSFSGSPVCNKLRIVLTPMDDYNLEFWQIPSARRIAQGAMPKLVKSFDTIYCDQLVDLFESTTHLYLSL